MLLVLVPGSATAEFLLNFDRDIFGGNGAENEGIGRVYEDDFIQMPVVVDGVEYYRTVVGDPASGFAMEAYTRRGAGSYSGPPDWLSNPGTVSFGLSTIGKCLTGVFFHINPPHLDTPV